MYTLPLVLYIYCINDTLYSMCNDKIWWAMAKDHRGWPQTTKSGELSKVGENRRFSALGAFGAPLLLGNPQTIKF